MKKSFSAICFVVLFCITGCANTTSGPESDMTSGNESEAADVSDLLSSNKTEQSHDKSDSEEIVSSEITVEQTPTALIPAVMIDGMIYYLSQGHNIPAEKINRDQIDCTVSEVPLGTYPEKDGESNYALAGTPYVKYENGYALQIEENGWTLFLTWEDRLAEEW